MYLILQCHVDIETHIEKGCFHVIYRRTGNFRAEDIFAVFAVGV